MAGRLWAAKDKRALRKLYPAYKRKEVTRQQMKRVFGRSWDSISQKAGQLGLTGKTFNRFRLGFVGLIYVDIGIGTEVVELRHRDRTLEKI